MVKVVKSQPADHSTKGTESAVCYHIGSSYAYYYSSSSMHTNSRTAVQRSTCARMNRARKEHRMILWRIMTKTEN
jgi:hypothetical protein